VGLTQQLHRQILHEIVRVVESRRKVPARLTIRGKRYELTYLEDHRHRMEEAIRRGDVDRLGMLYGQLSSKVKYQLKRTTRRAASAGRPAAKKSASATRKVTKTKK